MSRNSPAGFVLSVAAEVAAVVFIVSVLPRVDLRTSAGAAPTASSSPSIPHDPFALLPSVANLPAASDRRPAAPAFETAYDQRTPSGTDARLFHREPPPLIAVDPSRPDYVEQRLDRASQRLVNGVGSYLTHAATDLLPASPAAAAIPNRSPAAPAPARLSQNPTPRTTQFPSAPTFSGSFPTQPIAPEPRPWVRY
jgi:hypothetical protein